MTISDLLDMITHKYKGWVLENFVENFPEPGSFFRLKLPRSNILATFDIEDDEVNWKLNSVPASGLDYENLMIIINVLEHIKQDIENSLFY